MSIDPVISPTPPAPKNRQDEKNRPIASALYRALKARGEAGLTWREAWLVLDEAGADESVAVGPLVIWLRHKGVRIVAGYRSGETVFFLEEPPFIGPIPPT